MSAEKQACGCGGSASAKWPTPGRVAKMTWAQYQAACFPEGLLVNVVDGPAPGLYVGLAGEACRVVTEKVLCELVRAAVQQVVGGA